MFKNDIKRKGEERKIDGCHLKFVNEAMKFNCDISLTNDLQRRVDVISKFLTRQ